MPKPRIVRAFLWMLKIHQRWAGAI